MKRTIPLLLGILLTACAAPTKFTPTAAVAQVIVTSEVTVTSMPFPTSTPTPEATATPEAPEVKMTLEDWKKVFVGKFISNDGNEYDLNHVFDESDLLTGEDAIKKLKSMEVGNTTSITILNPDGKVTIIAEPDFAIQRVQEGACILVTRDGRNVPATHSIFILGAAVQDFRNGTNKITKIEFGEITSVRFSSNPPDSLSLKYFYLPIKHMIDMPKHFKVNFTQFDDPVSISQAGIEITDPSKWIDTLNDAGVMYIKIYAQ